MNSIRQPTTIIAISAGLVVSIAFTLWSKIYRRPLGEALANGRQWPAVPGKLPFLGNALQIGGLSRLFDQIQNWAEDYGQQDGIFEFSLMGTTFVVACRQDRLLELMKFRPLALVRSNKAKSVALSIGAKGVFAAEGHEWKSDRRLVAPALNRKHVREYFNNMKLVAKRLVKKWSNIMESSSNGTVAINHDLYSASIDTLSLTVYGKDANTLETLSDQTSKDVVAILDIATLRMFSPIAYWEIPFIGPYLDGGEFIKTRLFLALDDLITRHLNELDSSRSDSQGINAHQTTIHTKQTNYNNTFLGRILELSQQSNDSMPRERLIGQLLTLFLGGSDSVGTLLCTALWLVAVDPELQEELVNELLHESQLDLDKASMGDMLEKLPRMRSFLMEVIRCYGPTPLIFLGAAQDLHLKKVGASKNAIIPSGTEVILLSRVASLHRTAPPPEVPMGPKGEEVPPSEFCPRRWLVQGSSDQDGVDDTDGSVSAADTVRVELPSLKSGVHMSFGHGSRMCPGKDFAELEIMTGISYVLLEFEIALSEHENGDEASLHQIKLSLRKRR